MNQMHFLRLRVLRAASGLALGGAVLGACSKPPLAAPSPPPPPPRAPVEVPPPRARATPTPEDREKLPFAARASAATEDQAYAAARRRLLVALLNEETLLIEEPFSNQLAQSVHDRQADPFKQEARADGVEVEVGLRADGLETALSRLQQALEQVDLASIPFALRKPVAKLRTAMLQTVICQRQNDLIQKTEVEKTEVEKTEVEKTECAAPSADQAERELKATLDRIVLRPHYEGGIPTTGETFLRPLKVTALIRQKQEEPLPGLPLILSLPEAENPESLESDEHGELSFDIPKGTAIDARFRVDVDLTRLLGVALPSIQLAPVWIKGRKTSMARSALLALDQKGAGKTVGSATERALAGLMSHKVELDREHVARLVSGSPKIWKTLLPELADAYGGRLDQVVFVEAESEFASRMGTHRVWFEARGKILAFDAWTGELKSEAESAVTESGVGEKRAELAAQQALGRDLASKLTTALKNQSEN